MDSVPAPLILASASPRRHDLMREAGYAFETVTADVEEIEDPRLSLPRLTEQNARLKADAVADDHPRALVIGADTLVTIDGLALGKPADLTEAASTLEKLTGRTHEVCTGVCLTRREPATCRQFHVVTQVTFRPLDRAEIDHYLGLINPLDKAGAYAAQEHGSLIIEKTEGSWTNVVGLPMDELREALESFPGGGGAGVEQD